MEQHSAASRYTFLDIVVDTGCRRVARGSEVIPLPRLSYELLIALLEAAPNALSYDDLVDRVWNGRLTSPETVKQRVKLLRDALADDASEPRYIGLVRGHGYRLLPDVSIPNPEPGIRGRPRARAHRRHVFALGIALAVALASLVGWLRVTTASRPVAVAVIPFVSSTDERNPVVADGMTHGLASELAELGEFEVLSTRSTSRYRGYDQPLQRAAAALDADWLVSGSISSDDRLLNATVVLTNVTSQASVWTESFNFDIEEMPRLEAEIAHAIATNLGASPPVSHGNRADRDRRVDREVYELYLRGMHALNKSTPADVEMGLRYLHEAVEKDPGNADAYAGLALGYATYAHGFEPGVDAWPRAAEAAERAIMLDPGLAEAYAALADVKLYMEWDWDGARVAFERANELNPSLAMNHYHYAWYLALFGRFDEAIEEHRKAKRLDPLTPLHSVWLGALYLAADSSRYPEAIAEVESALRLSPDNPSALFVLALAQATGGMHAEAISTMERAAVLAPPMRPALGFIYSLAGRDDLARHILSELAAQRPTPWTAYWQFMINSRLGNLDEAFEWLAFEPHHAYVPWVRIDPWVRPLIEHDPRFQQFLERAGLDP